MKKEFILECARSIIRNQGVQHLFMDEVARQCGISKKTIYEIFESKEVLLESLANSFVEEQKLFFLNTLLQQSDVVNKINFILSFTFELMHLVPQQNLIFLEKRYSKTYHILNAFLEEVIEQLRTFMTEAQQENLIYADVDIHKTLRFLKTDLQFLHKHYRVFLAENALESWQHQLMQSFRRSIFIRFMPE